MPSPKQLNDNTWHVFRCVHTAKQIQVWVDGVQVAAKNFVTGPIDNAQPFVIGGKTRCDQVRVTCDYYTGAHRLGQDLQRRRSHAGPPADGDLHLGVRWAHVHLRRVSLLGSRGSGALVRVGFR